MFLKSGAHLIDLIDRIAGARRAQPDWPWGHCGPAGQSDAAATTISRMALRETALNVLAQPLQACSYDPLTGYLRDGCCSTDERDAGLHLVCAVMTAEFLEYSRSQGNDLITPRPEWRFKGLKPGNRWCLCALRWKEALKAGVAPKVVLQSTHIRALDVLDLEDLLTHSHG